MTPIRERRSRSNGRQGEGTPVSGVREKLRSSTQRGGRERDYLAVKGFVCWRRTVGKEEGGGGEGWHGDRYLIVRLSSPIKKKGHTSASLGMRTFTHSSMCSGGGYEVGRFWKRGVWKPRKEWGVPQRHGGSLSKKGGEMGSVARSWPHEKSNRRKGGWFMQIEGGGRGVLPSREKGG